MNSLECVGDEKRVSLFGTRCPPPDRPKWPVNDHQGWVGGWSDTAGSDASVVMASWRMASRVSHLQLCTVAGTHMRCGVPRIDASVLRYLNSWQQGYIAYLLAVAILAAVHAHALPAAGSASRWRLLALGVQWIQSKRRFRSDLMHQRCASD